MTLDEFIAELPLAGPWELRGPHQAIRTANDRCDCPLAAVTRLACPQANVSRILKQHAENPIHVLGRRLGLTVDEAELVADAADGLDAWAAEYEGANWSRFVELRGRMLAACGLASDAGDAAPTGRAA